MTEELYQVVVKTPLAPLFAEPKVASAQISQLLAGRTCDVLEERDDWFLVRGPDEYEGWINRGFLSATGQTSADVRISLGCVTANGSDAQRAMPLGAFLSPTERVERGDVIASSERGGAFPADAESLTRSALRFFEGTSYIWGGVTPWGADCSGLVQSTFWLHGIQLRRDAWQQAEQGSPGDSDILASRGGDLLFFSDRVDQHITHVAIALGGRALVHLALGRGGYAVENLDDRCDPYVQKLLDRFVHSRRILAGADAGR